LLLLSRTNINKLHTNSHTNPVSSHNSTRSCKGDSTHPSAIIGSHYHMSIAMRPDKSQNYTGYHLILVLLWQMLSYMNDKRHFLVLHRLNQLWKNHLWISWELFINLFYLPVRIYITYTILYMYTLFTFTEIVRVVTSERSPLLPGVSNWFQWYLNSLPFGCGVNVLPLDHMHHTKPNKYNLTNQPKTRQYYTFCKSSQYFDLVLSNAGMFFRVWRYTDKCSRHCSRSEDIWCIRKNKWLWWWW